MVGGGGGGGGIECFDTLSLSLSFPFHPFPGVSLGSVFYPEGLGGKIFPPKVQNPPPPPPNYRILNC